MKEIGKERKIAIVALIVAVLMLTVAFAAMSRTLKINGTAKVDSAAWDIHFKSSKMLDKKGDAREVAGPKISEDGINLTLKVGLRKPKDEITYEAIIENKGDIDAEIESIEYPTLSEDQAKIIEFIATYDDGREISKSQELKAKEEKTVKIVIRYKDITDESLLAKETYDIPLTFKINYIQKGFATQSTPEGGDIIIDDTSKTYLAYTEVMSADDPTVTSFANSPITRSKIETLSFEKSNGDVRSGTTWDASEAVDESIIGYYTDDNNDGLYDVVIESTSNIYAPVDSSAFFASMSSLKELNFNNFKTNDATTMQGMFALTTVTNLDLTSFDTSNVTNMNTMFYNCTSLTNLDLSSFDTSKVTDMSYMFGRSSSLINLDLSSFDTSNVTVMFHMFWKCSSLTSLDLSSFNTSNVTNMESMFNGCSSLTSLDLSLFNTSNVTNMESMFNGCSSLIELKINSAEFSSVSNNNFMLGSVSDITIYVKDQAAIDFLSTTDVTNAEYKIAPLES